MQSTPVHKWRYVASKLLSRLTGPARLLAMSWSKIGFDSADGVKIFLQRLAASPLVRRSLPNAAAICQQYFGFKRLQGESIQTFLVRETLMHEEFVEAIIRLHEDKLGVSQESRDFGLPTSQDLDDYEWEADYGWSSWWGNGDWYEGEYDEAERDDAAGAADSPEDGRSPGAEREEPRVTAATGSSPSHQRDGGGSVCDEPLATPEDKGVVKPTPLDELSLADSFILDVLRGWRLLQAAGLSHEEKRDILSTTKNSLDYTVISSALQGLWDDQLLGRHGGHQGGYNAHYLQDTDVNETYYQHGCWDDLDDDSAYGWWDDLYYTDVGYEDDWWYPNSDEYPEETYSAATAQEPDDPEAKTRFQEAQKAEQIAESLAAEANRTWAEAQRATQALRKDRGFGAVMQGKGAGGGRCFTCGGQHFARDCPDRRGPRPKGYGKHSSYAADYYDDLYFNKGKSKSKGKGKGKRSMWMEAQAWMKGKGKGKSKGKDTSRAVNAYASNMFVGGLELSESYELQSSSTSASNVHTGMLDCGATASAAPEAVVQGLIGSVLAKDKSAKIEFDQSARPYFRFGNGRWGRALCRVHMSSRVSGQLQTFSLYTLPSPAEYYQSNFDKQTLVPLLIGMDFLGNKGTGLLIDFGTGLAMCTKEENPEIFQLEVNPKGHYIYDIVYHLTRGNTCMEGNAHVLVRRCPLGSEADMSQQMLELRTTWIDLNASDRAHDEQSLANARARMWRLYQHGHSSTTPAAVTAQMCGSAFATSPTTTSSSSSHGDARGPRCSEALFDDNGSLRGPRDRGDPPGRLQGEGTSQTEGPILRHQPENENGSSRPSHQEDTVAMFRAAHSGSSSKQSTRAVDQLSMLQPPDALHSSQGEPSIEYRNSECRNGSGDAERAGDCARSCSSNRQDLSLCHGKGEGRLCVAQGDQRPPGQQRGGNNLGASGNGWVPLVTGDIGDNLGHGGRRGADCSYGGRSGPTVTTYKPVPSTPVYMGKKVTAMAAMMATATTSLLLGLHLEGRDGIWELACSPHSWLSEAAEEHGLRPRRINLSTGFDLYRHETWDRLQALRRQHRPQRLWFSLPCTKWCSWSSVNYNDPEKRERLEGYRRRERRMLKDAVDFILKTVDEDPDVEIYWEWLFPCFGWKQKPLEDLAAQLHRQGQDWLDCRIDGCVYGMKTEDNTAFLKKKWLIRTNNPVFHRAFRAKVCCGNHGVHGHIEGQETARSSYYPWKLVQAWTRHWKGQMVPERHLRLLQQPDWDDNNDDLKADLETGSDLPDVEFNTGYGGDVDDFYGEMTMFQHDKIMLESMAREARLKQSFDMETCEGLLQHLQAQLPASRVNKNERWSHELQQTLVLGCYSHGAFCGVTNQSLRYPELVRYVNYYLRHYLPDLGWSSVMLTFNGHALPHRDHHNLKGTLNVVHGLGNYSGGELWMQGQPPPGLPAVRRKTPDGSLQLGYVRPTWHAFVDFRPEVLHGTQKHTGSCIYISAYTTRLLDQLPAEKRHQLHNLGFPLKAIQVATYLDGTLCPTLKEPDVTQDTAEVGSELRARWEAQIAKFHKAAGHPSNRNLARIIKEAGHEEWKVEMARNYHCPACASLKSGGTSSGSVPPATTHKMYSAWHAVGVDSGEWIPPGSKIKVKFLLLMDLATKLRVVCPLFSYDFLEMRTESGHDLIKAFSERWLSLFPKPKLLVLDAARSFSSDAASM